MRVKRLALLLLAYAVGGAIIWVLPCPLAQTGLNKYGLVGPFGTMTDELWWIGADQVHVYWPQVWASVVLSVLVVAIVQFCLWHFERECRRIRARRGQCPACAYPIGASNVCTECGAAVRLSSPP